MPCIIYADNKSLIKKVNGSASNPKNSWTTIIPCGYSMSTSWPFYYKENKHTLYRGKDSFKRFCDSLREHAENIIDFEKKKCYS